MIIKCKECNTKVEVDDSDYEVGVKSSTICPLCGETIYFTIPKPIEKPVPQEQIKPDPLHEENYKCCPACGNAIKTDIKFCPNCGQRIDANDIPVVQLVETNNQVAPIYNGDYVELSSETTPVNTQYTPVAKPDNHMLLAIATTVLCCVPLGIYSIIQAAKVNTLYKSGQYEEALKASSTAKKWSIIGLICGVVCNVLYYFFIAIANSR